ncbi:MAG: YceH family protein [Acidobacteriota bacterium]
MPLPRQLDAIEIRVLGALMEKEQATPEYYPLTLNALLAACNQKNNRSPVLDLAEHTVREALERLAHEVLVWRSEGVRVERWRHSTARRWELDPPAKALLTLLMLRGPQTAAELKSRAERMHVFSTLEEAEQVLARMAAGGDPLVTLLARRPGQVEPRWMHLLGGPVAEAPEPVVETAAGSLATRVERLEQEVASLGERLAALVAQLGG